MRKLVLISALLISLSPMSFAATLSKSSSMNALASVWKSQHATQPIQMQNDITMVYGGADVSHRPLASHTAIG